MNICVDTFALRRDQKKKRGPVLLTVPVGGDIVERLKLYLNNFAGSIL